MIKDFRTFINESKRKDPFSKRYHYFYKVENKENGNFYYGIHSTDNMEDGYMGSGRRLKEVYKEAGKENFILTPIQQFSSRQEALDHERKIVNRELLTDDKCYNLTIGGGGHPETPWLATVTDGTKNFVVRIDDERYRKGELKGITFGKAHYLDENGNVVCITPEEAKKRGLRGHTFGKIPARKKGSNEKFKLIPIVDFNSDEYETPTTGKIVTKDSDDNIYCVSKNDERYISGELKPIWVGKTHNDDTKKKMSMSHQLNGDQQGEKNSQYGTIWMVNPKKKIDKKFIVNTEEDLIEKFEDGWIPGRISGTTSKWYNKYLETGDIPTKITSTDGSINKIQKIYNSWKKIQQT